MDLLSILQVAIHYAISGLSIYVVVVGLLAAVTAVVQEYKVWAPPSVPSLSFFGCLKVFSYTILWMATCLVGTIIVSTKWILMLGASDIASECNLWVENYAAHACVAVFLGKVQVTGSENLPKENTVPAPVLIANHSSQIDVGMPYYLGSKQRFKWIAKQSVLYIPGVGQCSYLGDHVIIDRRTGKNQGSVSNLYAKSNAAVQAGIPMFIFPQGTRRIAEKLPFKKGAFVVAQTNKSPLIPLSFEIPKNIWNVPYPFNLLWGGSAPVVKVTVHKPIPASDDLDALKQRCMDQIYSVLPEVDGETNKDK